MTENHVTPFNIYKDIIHLFDNIVTTVQFLS
jgi:hypothetical protein